MYHLFIKCDWLLIACMKMSEYHYPKLDSDSFPFLLLALIFICTLFTPLVVNIFLSGTSIAFKSTILDSGAGMSIPPFFVF